MGLFGTSENIILNVEGMTCEHCEMKVQNALKATAGVKKVVSVDKNAGKATLQLKKGIEVTAETLINAVVEAGYSASATD